MEIVEGLEGRLNLSEAAAGWENIRILRAGVDEHIDDFPVVTRFHRLEFNLQVPGALLKVSDVLWPMADLTDTVMVSEGNIVEY